jgi:hypothetical protein
VRACVLRAWGEQREECTTAATMDAPGALENAMHAERGASKQRFTKAVGRGGRGGGRGSGVEGQVRPGQAGKCKLRSAEAGWLEATAR